MVNMLVWVTPPKFNSSPLKNDGWKTSLSFWYGIFSGAMLNFQGLIYHLGLITMVSCCPLNGIIPLLYSAFSWLLKRGDPNHLQILGWSSMYCIHGVLNQKKCLCMYKHVLWGMKKWCMMQVSPTMMQVSPSMMQVSPTGFTWNNIGQLRGTISFSSYPSETWITKFTAEEWNAVWTITNGLPKKQWPPKFNIDTPNSRMLKGIHLKKTHHLLWVSM